MALRQLHPPAQWCAPPPPPRMLSSLLTQRCDVLTTLPIAACTSRPTPVALPAPCSQLHPSSARDCGRLELRNVLRLHALLLLARHVACSPRLCDASAAAEHRGGQACEPPRTRGGASVTCLLTAADGKECRRFCTLYLQSDRNVDRG